MDVTGSVFSRRGEEGDFGWMIDEPQYADALFVFNDNQEQFLAHRQHPGSSLGCQQGGGNAIIRPYQCVDPPRAAGIPTGSLGQGYTELSADVKRYVDAAIATIRERVETFGYNRVIYSAADERGELGTGIFKVGATVKEYIVRELRKLDDGIG